MTHKGLVLHLIKYTSRPKSPLRMEENEIITQFIENPSDEYLLQLIVKLFRNQSLDFLTYELICNKVLDRLLDLMQTSPSRLYEEVVARVWDRYRNERFPSLAL